VAEKNHLFTTPRAKLSGAVYCYRSCVFATGGRADDRRRAAGRSDGVCGGRAVSVTTRTRNCVRRFSPNLVCQIFWLWLTIQL